MVHPRADAGDEQLVSETLAGDRAAFSSLVQRHRAGVTRVLQAMFGNLVGVEDLVQESFLRAFLDLERLRDRQRFGAWVRSIAVNLARMELRSGRLPVHAEGLRFGELAATEPSPEWLAERREMLRRIREAIATLPPGEREAIVQVYLRELSHEEAAEALNTSSSAIKVRVHRGRRRLRAALETEILSADRREEAEMVEMIEVMVADVLARLAEGETMPRIDPAESTIEQAHQWLLRLASDGHRVILLAEKEGQRVLPIWVGPVEAESIVIQMQGISPMRPMTFDLMKEIIAVGRMELQGVAISRLHETVFYGTLTVQANGAGAQTEIDCRPSDAINLALRVGAPIFVAPEIMAQEGVTAKTDADYAYLPSETGHQWRSLLNSV